MTGEEFRPIFEKTLELGLNLWDTATAYSNGESEKILGGFVNDAGRENVIVSTKFTPQMAPMYDNSVEKMCEASLERMGLDYIDIYWIHNPVGAPEYIKQLISLLGSGKVKVAKKLAEAAVTDFYEIKQEIPYTKADLDWMNKKSRSTVEMGDKTSRPALVDKAAEISQYDTIFIGFPKMEYAFWLCK